MANRHQPNTHKHNEHISIMISNQSIEWPMAHATIPTNATTTSSVYHPTTSIENQYDYCIALSPFQGPTAIDRCALVRRLFGRCVALLFATL